MGKRKVIATIMTKNLITDNLYLFKYDYSVTGTFDEETQIFTDDMGNEFVSINDIDLLFSDEQKGFIDPAFVSELKKHFPDVKDKSVSNMIKSYDNVMKNRLYYIAAVESEISDNGYETVIVQQDVDTILDEMITKLSLSKHQRVLTFDANEDELNELGMSDQLAEFITDIFTGKYTPEELKKMFAYYNVDKENAESICDSIELRLEEERFNKMFGDDSNIDEVSLSDLTSKHDKEEISMDPIDLQQLRENIKKKLVNQDEPLKRITAELARMQVKGHEKNKGILIMGETGTGKTYMMDLLAQELDLPFLKIDSTQLTIPGYVGKNIEEYLWDLYINCGRNVEKAEKAIVFFDEIDKKGSSKKSDVSGQGVLNVLLKFLDGTTYDATEDAKNGYDTVKINTKNMIVVAGGAFTELTSDKNKSMAIGFNPNVPEINDNNIPKLDDFTKKAFMTEEFIGRFPIRIKLNKMDENSYERVLLESEDSTLKEEQRAFDKLGVKLSASPEYIKGVSKKAVDLKTGVRGLMGCVEESTWEAFEDVYSNPNKYEEIILGKDSIEDSKAYQKVLRKNKKDVNIAD